MMPWKFSDTEPKQMSGFNKPSEGSGQRDAFLVYLVLLDSSRESHSRKSWREQAGRGQEKVKEAAETVCLRPRKGHLCYGLIPLTQHYFCSRHLHWFVLRFASVWATSSGKTARTLLAEKYRYPNIRREIFTRYSTFCPGP